MQSLKIRERITLDPQQTLEIICDILAVFELLTEDFIVHIMYPWVHFMTSGVFYEMRVTCSTACFNAVWLLYVNTVQCLL
jgi:hypothetical protein